MTNIYRLNKHLDQWTELAMAWSNFEASGISTVLFMARLRGVGVELPRSVSLPIDNLIITFGRERWLMFFATNAEFLPDVGAKLDF